jgi:hypothetical protein
MTEKYTETTERERTLSVHCDICGVEICEPDHWADRSEVVIRYEHGTVYLEGGSTVEYEMDVCSHCFMTKILTLAPFGVEPRDNSF